MRLPLRLSARARSAHLHRKLHVAPGYLMGWVFAPAAFQAPLLLPDPWNAVEPPDNIGRGLLDNDEVEYDDRGDATHDTFC